MPDLTRKKLLEAILKSLLDASETNAIVKGGATFISEISRKIGDMPDEQKELLACVSAEELNDALQQARFAASHSAEAAAGVYRIAGNQKEMFATIKSIAESIQRLDAKTSPPAPLSGLSSLDCEVLRVAGDQVIANDKLGSWVSVPAIVDELEDSHGVNRCVRNLTELGYFSQGDSPTR